ncbi:hypothetical protein RHSIM_Rhsim01G0178700 [Rhododendron simsii]|uniref:Uncharacterized protein n=1 Tax=Rhododendron simsii TaxID=118357 RepID=A0A834HQK1_RHOSS|nr:hypothetical protein RHSIM_Rhsim01G0178700 [Rhododendron simsii]
MAMQRWHTCLEYISNPIQSHDIPLPTSSRGASQVAQPQTTSHIAQPQTTSQSKFSIPENDSAREAIKKKTLKLLGMTLRDWRCTLKGKYFDEAKTVAQIVATAPPTVNREHFADLVRYWFSEEEKNLSLKNKRGGDKSASVHTAGSKSYAQHAHELEVDSGFAPSRAKLYIPTHTKVDGKPVNDIAGEKIEAIKVLMESQPNGWEGNSKGSIFWSRDDIYFQVIHKKMWHGRVPGCGFGPTPKSSGSTCSDSPRFNVADEEERMRDKETICKLEDKVHEQAVELSTLKEQVAEMSTLKEQVAFMMRHMPEFTGLQVQDGCNGPFDQASPHAHQRSSHASHDIECSNGVLMSWNWSVCCWSVMAVVLSELVPVMGSDCYI